MIDDHDERSARELSRFREMLDVRDQVIRLDEKVGHRATREEMHHADMRILQEVSAIFERNSTVLREYMRGLVTEGGLKTEVAIQSLDARLKTYVDLQIAEKIAIASTPVEDRKQLQLHPAVTYGGTGAALTSLIGFLLWLLGSGKVNLG